MGLLPKSSPHPEHAAGGSAVAPAAPRKTQRELVMESLIRCPAPAIRQGSA
jgi:hypothetical protein